MDLGETLANRVVDEIYAQPVADNEPSMMDRGRTTRLLGADENGYKVLTNCWLKSSGKTEAVWLPQALECAGSLSASRCLCELC